MTYPNINWNACIQIVYIPHSKKVLLYTNINLNKIKIDISVNKTEIYFKKHVKLLLKCNPPEKILIGNNKLIQNKNKFNLPNSVNIISNIANLDSSFQITVIAYFILRISPLDKSFFFINLICKNINKAMHL